MTWGVPYFSELDKDIACVLRDTGLYEVRMGQRRASIREARSETSASSRSIDVDVQRQE
jgi:hypothetical protein